MANSYHLPFVSGADNPADATTYFIGWVPSVAFAVSSGIVSLTLRHTGIIRAVDVRLLVFGTPGTTETFSVWLRLNNTTDTLITSTAQANATINNFSNTGLSVAVVAGDFIEIKFTTPTWATNPTAVVVVGSVLVEQT